MDLGDSSSRSLVAASTRLWSALGDFRSSFWGVFGAALVLDVDEDDDDEDSSSTGYVSIDIDFCVGDGSESTQASDIVGVSFVEDNGDDDDEPSSDDEEVSIDVSSAIV